MDLHQHLKIKLRDNFKAKEVETPSTEKPLLLKHLIKGNPYLIFLLTLQLSLFF